MDNFHEWVVLKGLPCISAKFLTFPVPHTGISKATNLSQINNIGGRDEEITSMVYCIVEMLISTWRQHKYRLLSVVHVQIIKVLIQEK